ncbi:MAG TPA: SpoIID/LytB domain-containing protein [Acidimicrobiales bacterium]|nr:SpoIID/LytB domain-containing protein [Acidimicrobiales bacterium]
MKELFIVIGALSRHISRTVLVSLAALTVLLSTSAVVVGAAPKQDHFRRVTTVMLVGHGWGSGIGLGQWGAFGYAVRYHFGYERILNHYYGTTVPALLSATGQPPDPTISVVILENMNLATNLGYDPIVTSSQPFTVTSSGGTPVVAATTKTTTTSTSTTSTTSSTSITVAPSTVAPPPVMSFTVPAGTAIDLQLGSNGTWNAYEGSTCQGASQAITTTPIATGLMNPVVSPTVTVDAAASQLLVLCRHDGVDESVRGSIEAYDRSGYERTLNLLPLESYLRSVVPSESSASWGLDGTTTNSPLGRPWGFQALEAQAVAARSYAMSYDESGGWNGYAGICDTTQCQVYAGANFESSVSDAAVAATAGEIRIFPATPTLAVSTQFSASTGGFTAPSIFPPVHDLGDSCVIPTDPLECNPNHSWSMTLAGTQITRDFRAIGRLSMVHVSARNGHGAYGGRAETVLLKGSKGFIRVPVSEFVGALGLKSDWFAVARVTRFGQTPVTTTTLPVTTTTVPSG